MPSLAPVTVVGLGPMGRALAAAFAGAGHPTTVWNRTPGRANELDVTEPGDLDTAVSSAAVVVVCLRDDEAVGAVLEPVRDRLRGRTLVNLTSSTPAQSRERAAWAAAAGLDHLDGAILTPAPTIGTDAAALLYAGPRVSYDRVSATLAALGGSADHLGTDPGLAAAQDVAYLAMFSLAMLGIGQGLAIGQAEGVDLDALAEATRAVAAMLPEMATRFADQLRAGEFPGTVSTVASEAVTMHHIADTARERRLPTALVDAARDLMDGAVAAGYGDDGLGRMAERLAS